MDGELEQLGERIAEQAVHLDAAMHRLLADLREFDRRGGWRPQGAKTCAHWLAWRVGWDLVTARERVRVANRLGELPEIDEALRRGEVSYAKVRAMVRVATVDNQALLLGYAREMTGAQLERLSRKLGLVARHEAVPDPRVDAERRYVRRRDTDDGMVKIEAVLHPEEAAVVWAMLDHAAARGVVAGTAGDSAESARVDPDVAADAEVVDRVVESAVDVARIRSVGDSAESPASQSELRRREVAQRSAFDRADALVSIAQGYVRGDRPERSPIEVTITIEERGLREATGAAEVAAEVADLGDGFVSSAAARRLACDASVVELREAPDGTPLALGRKRRTVSGALKRALLRRDAMCCFPGCTRSTPRQPQMPIVVLRERPRVVTVERSRGWPSLRQYARALRGIADLAGRAVRGAARGAPPAHAAVTRRAAAALAA